MLKRSLLVLFFCTSLHIIAKQDPNLTEESDSSDSELSPIFQISDDDSSSSEDESSDEEAQNNNFEDDSSSDDGYFFVPLTGNNPEPHEETEAVLPGSPLIMPQDSTLYEGDSTLEQPVPNYQQLLASMIAQTMGQALSLAVQADQFDNESNTLQAQQNTFSRIIPVPRAQNPRRNRPANLATRRSVQDPRRLNPINRRHRPTTRLTQAPTNEMPQSLINSFTQIATNQETPHTPENQIVYREDIPTPGAPVARRRLNFSQRRRGARRGRRPYNPSNNQRMD